MPFKTYLEVLRSGNPLRFALLINISKAFTVVASLKERLVADSWLMAGFSLHEKLIAFREKMLTKSDNESSSCRSNLRLSHSAQAFTTFFSISTLPCSSSKISIIVDFDEYAAILFIPIRLCMHLSINTLNMHEGIWQATIPAMFFFCKLHDRVRRVLGTST